jgi:hypothetical protein
VTGGATVMPYVRVPGVWHGLDGCGGLMVKLGGGVGASPQLHWHWSGWHRIRLAGGQKKPRHDGRGKDGGQVAVNCYSSRSRLATSILLSNQSLSSWLQSLQVCSNQCLAIVSDDGSLRENT